MFYNPIQSAGNTASGCLEDSDEIITLITSSVSGLDCSLLSALGWACFHGNSKGTNDSISYPQFNSAHLQGDIKSM